jgi:phosphatidylserine decarboxylase
VNSSVGTYAAAQLLRVLPRAGITRAVGRLCDLRLPAPVSRAVVSLYARAYAVDLAEAEPLNGSGAYASFDAFFTRRLRSGARESLAPATALVSPADGRLDAVGRVSRGGLVAVKGRPYRAADLLGDEGEADRYAGGQLAVVYLSPRDYHRVHAPFAGRVTEVRSYPGDLFPVNGLSEAHIPGYLARNRRVAIVLETAGAGKITLVMVAAMIVGRVTVSGVEAKDVPLGRRRLDPPVARARGEEIGIFHLGSSVVLFTEAEAFAPIDRALGRIRLGEALTGSAAPERGARP